MTKAAAITRAQTEAPPIASPGVTASPSARAEIAFRFSGHQTFPLRIAWLPKAIREISRGCDPLTNIDEGITKLGLGKNMVEALRCWIEAFQIAYRSNGRWSMTSLGDMVFNLEGGLDPYLEDVSTSWLLHWLICTNVDAPFFAWECLFNLWPSTEFSGSQAIDAFAREAKRAPRPASEVTLRQHWEVFLHSYLPSRATKGEDHLDSAMSAIRLIRRCGERPNAAGKWETIFAFDTARKSGISQQLFTFFVHSWWNRHFPKERTTPLRELVMGAHSPGRLLKMQESEILQRVTEMAERQPKMFQVVESTSLRQLRRFQESDGLADVKNAYLAPTFI